MPWQAWQAVDHTKNPPLTDLCYHVDHYPPVCEEPVRKKCRDHEKIELKLCFSLVFLCQHEEKTSLGWDGAQAATLQFFRQCLSAAVTLMQEQCEEHFMLPLCWTWAAERVKSMHWAIVALQRLLWSSIGAFTGALPNGRGDEETPKLAVAARGRNQLLAALSALP